MSPRQLATGQKAKPYEAVLIEDGWKAMVSWEKRREENGWRLVGECPRCNHRMDKFFPDHVLAMGVQADGTAPAEQVKENVVSCDCSEPHPGRDSSANGCGAHWGIKVEAGPEADELQEGS